MSDWDILIQTATYATLTFIVATGPVFLLIVFGQKSVIEKAKKSKLGLRFISLIILVSVALSLAYLGGVPFAILIALFVILGIKELHEVSKKCSPVWFGYLLSILLLLCLILWFVTRSSPGGFGKLVFVLVVVQIFDVASFFGGMFAGKHRLTIVSPKKTWEGLAVGLSCAFGAGVVFHYTIAIYPIVITAFIAACLVCTGLVGDILTSALKRFAKVKDFSSIIPGHGGVIDRLDSYILSTPLAWFLFSIELDEMTIIVFFLIIAACSAAVIYYLDRYFKNMNQE